MVVPVLKHQLYVVPDCVQVPVVMEEEVMEERVVAFDSFDSIHLIQFIQFDSFEQQQHIH